MAGGTPAVIIGLQYVVGGAHCALCLIAPIPKQAMIHSQKWTRRAILRCFSTQNPMALLKIDSGRFRLSHRLPGKTVKNGAPTGRSLRCELIKVKQ